MSHGVEDMKRWKSGGSFDRNRSGRERERKERKSKDRHCKIDGMRIMKHWNVFSKKWGRDWE